MPATTAANKERDTMNFQITVTDLTSTRIYSVEANSERGAVLKLGKLDQSGWKKIADSKYVVHSDISKTIRASATVTPA
jgi:hypothetical protein